MAEDWKDEPWAKDESFWYSGKLTRRRLLGLGAATAGALGAGMLVPAPWWSAFGQAKTLKIGTLQPLSCAAAAGGKTALVGTQMAVDRINKAGGINGRMIELVVADYESKPDVGRRKAEKLAVEDKIDAHEGGFLSNVCLACMPVWEEHKIVNMVGVCLDTTMTTKNCSAGGEIVGTTGIPLGTADMTPFLSKITGSFDGFFGIFFGKDGVTIGNQAFDLGMTKKYRWAGDGAIAEATNLPALGSKIEGFVGINRYVPVLDAPLNTAHHKKFFDDAVARLKQIDPSGPLPDRYVQANFEAMNALKVGMQKSGFRGRQDTMKLIEALEGLEMKESDDFFQGDKTLRKADHQAFLREFIFDIKGGKHHILEVVPKEKTMFPPACTFA